MIGRLARILFALAGATAGALAVALVEARGIVVGAGAHPPPPLGVVLAELGVLAPLALAIGAVVWAVSAFLEPERPRSPAERVAAWRRAPVLTRSRTAALGPLAVAAGSLWLVFTAQAARTLLASGAPMAAGAAVGIVASVSLVWFFALALACLPALRRSLADAASRRPSRWRWALDPAATTGAVVALAVIVVALGACAGDTGGAGAGPVAVFGVLKRHELDLRPPVHLIAVAACAWTALLAFAGRSPSWRRVALAAAVPVAALVITVHEAEALERDPSVAELIEARAPLGRVALALDRKATDRDGDGASPLFGGGDCNDGDPSISPLAIDVPGNGIDEDCSGEDSVASAPSSPAAAGAPPALSATPPNRAFNLILVTVDTLRASELGFEGYDEPTSPHLDALAARSVVFDRAYSMASYTGKALAPMLIGKYPSETLRDGGHFNKYFAGNTFLAERLQAAGIFTMGAASHWYFHDSWGVTQGFDVFDLSALPKAGQTDTDTNSTSPALTDAAIRLLESRASGGRFFLWVHYFDPHAQYVPHAGAPDFAHGVTSTAARMRALYDGEVWFTDRAVGKLLDYVDAQPWGRDTIVVVTSDHGESMGEHGIAFQHGFELWETLMRVPFVVSVPGLRPHRVPVKRSMIDLVPTLLDLMRVPSPPPGELSGTSATADLLAGPGDPFEERDVYMDMPDGPYTHLRRALIHGTTPGMKLIHLGGRQYKLFDLAEDPDETNDLAGDPAKLGPMVQALQAKRAELKEVFVKADAPAVP